MKRILLTTSILLSILCLPGFSQEINFYQAKGSPYFESPEVMIDSAEFNTLVLKIDAKTDGLARLFWTNHYSMRFDQPKSILFYLKAGQHNYYVNLASQNNNWIGWTRKLLIMPDNAYIVSAKAEPTQGNLLTNIASAWQEFWGPKGRIVIGSTINLIPSSAIFGRSINIYIYWVVLLAFFAVFFAQIIKTKDLTASFNASGKYALIIALGCWILLTLNTDINYLKTFRSNWSKYFGKSIDEKRAIAYGQEYFNFLEFTKKNFPKEPVKFGFLSSRFAADLKARIYLVPHHYVSNPERAKPYLVVFYPDPKDTQVLKDYIIFAKFNNNAYLMKRIEL